MNYEQQQQFEQTEAKDYSPVLSGYGSATGIPLYQVHFKGHDGAWYPCSCHGKNDPVNIEKAVARAADFSFSDQLGSLDYEDD